MEKQLEGKERILNAAVKLFSEKGYNATSVRDIVSEANINVSMVSYYYKGKRGILEEILKDFFNKLKAFLNCWEPEQVQSDSEETIERIIGFFWDNKTQLKIFLDEAGSHYNNIGELKEIASAEIHRISKILDDNTPVENWNAISIIEMWLGMILSGEILRLTDLIPDNWNRTKEEREKKKKDIVLKLTKIIWHNRQDF